MTVGIDFGTSSVKVLFADENGIRKVVRKPYEGEPPQCWKNALKEALSEGDASEISEIGLSSQVGTYVVNDKDVIPWNCGVGGCETRQIKEMFSAEKFIEEISMPHPDIVSYPIPRLMYIKNNYEKISSVCQLKDYICEFLTGNYVSDIYSWRGLANLEKGIYSNEFLKFLGISENVLPRLLKPTDCGGKINGEASEYLGIPEGIPVAVGLNDFYSSLLGMGIKSEGDMFDITGTSEHLGIITKTVKKDTKLVSSPYVAGNVLYGVTASSGAAQDMAINRFCGGEYSFEGYEPNENTPIFLPYQCGERAPIFDADARGVFFGITGNTKEIDFAYSVFEGVVFSLKNISEYFDEDITGKRVVFSGGAAKNDFLNQLKADVLKVKIEVPKELDTSALGAVASAVAMKNNISIEAAGEKFCRTFKTFLPRKGKNFEKRFEIYKKLYQNTKNLFKELKEVHI